MSDERSAVDRHGIVLAVVASTVVAVVSWLVVGLTSTSVPGLLCHLVVVCLSQVPFGPEECGACSMRARASAYLWLVLQSGVLAFVARRCATRWMSTADAGRFAATFGLTFWAFSHLSYGLTFAVGQLLILLVFGPV